MGLAVIIQSKIYEIRGQKVVIDKDFMFQLTAEEWNSLRFQIGILEKGKGKYTKYLPYAFTEQGLAMLSGVLNSGTAIKINIAIMRAFVAVRQLIANPPTNQIGQLQQELNDFKTYIEEVFTDYNNINEDTRLQLELINQTLAELQSQKRPPDKPRNPIGFVKPE